MSVTTDIVQTWKNPKLVMRRHLQRGQSEPFVFSLLVAFLILAFVALWPEMSRLAFLEPDVPLSQRMLAAGLGMLASIPFWYALALLATYVARAFGLRPSGYVGRLALFAAALGAGPLLLLQGLLAGIVGSSAGLTLVQILAGLAFLWFWIMMLVEGARG